MFVKYRVMCSLICTFVVLFFCYWFGLLAFSYIEISGDGEKAAGDSVERSIRDWKGLHFLTRSDKIARFLQKSAWVDHVEVYKSFDGGLRLTLGYRVPVLRSISGRFLVDSGGHLIDVYVSDDLLRLPIFDGDVHSARQAYRLWSRLGVWKGRVLSMICDEFSGWEVLFDNKVTVRLGGRNLVDRLDLFLKVAEHWSLQESNQEQVFDMRYNKSFSHKVATKE